VYKVFSLSLREAKPFDVAQGSEHVELRRSNLAVLKAYLKARLPRRRLIIFIVGGSQ
jgi:hypothetical protein